MEDCFSAVKEVNETIRDRNQLLEELKGHLTVVQDKMKSYVDKHRRDVQFEVVDTVYLKTCPYKLKSLIKKPHEKLSPRFYGPYKILEKYGETAYKLELSQTTKIHQVFRVSQLKRSLQPIATQQSRDVTNVAIIHYQFYRHISMDFESWLKNL